MRQTKGLDNQKGMGDIK